MKVNVYWGDLYPQTTSNLFISFSILANNQLDEAFFSFGMLMNVFTNHKWLMWIVKSEFLYKFFL